MNADMMYQEIILDYYRNPKNFGTLENPTFAERDVNPSCGDVVEIHALIEGNTVKDIKFSGKGCAISQAASSMLTEHLKGKNIDEVKKLQKEDILEMLGIEISGIRLKCALLGLKVMKLGTYKYLGENLEEEHDFA